MLRRIYKSSAVPAVMLAVVLSVSCGGGGAAAPSDAPDTSVLSTLAITPSAVSVAVGGSASLQAEARTASGRVIPGVSMAFVSGDNTVATVDAAGTVRGVTQGATVVTVTGTLNGRIATADVPVTVGATGTAGPPANVATSGDNFVPPTVTIAAGGSVTWQIAGNTHNVTFGSLKPVGGDVPNTPSGGSATRVCTNAGTYLYDVAAGARRHVCHSGRNFATLGYSARWKRRVYLGTGPASIRVGEQLDRYSEWFGAGDRCSQWHSTYYCIVDGEWYYSYRDERCHCWSAVRDRYDQRE